MVDSDCDCESGIAACLKVSIPNQETGVRVPSVACLEVLSSLFFEQLKDTTGAGVGERL